MYTTRTHAHDNAAGVMNFFHEEHMRDFMTAFFFNPSDSTFLF